MNVRIYVDASYEQQYRIAGWGIMARCKSESIMRCGDEKGINSSLDAEMVAAYCGVVAATREWNSISKITIISDCNDIIKQLNGISYSGKKREARKFRDSLVQDIELIAKEESIEMAYRHTKGHCPGIESVSTVSNKCVDSLARAARFAALVKHCSLG
jgi:ribonuclease HI